MVVKVQRVLLRGMTCVLSVLLLLVLFGTNAFAADEHEAVDVTDAEGFVAALGGEDKATYEIEDDVCTITLTDDVELNLTLRVSAGSYVIKGSSTISRAEGYTYVLLDVQKGASVELTDSVVIDGGAVWTKDDMPSDSAVGASNQGVEAEASLVDVHGGTLIVSGSATLRNNDRYAAIWSDQGTVEVTGGTICGNSTTKNWETYGAAVHGYSSSNILITGGVFSGNAGAAAVMSYSPAVSGGTFSGNTGAVRGVSNVKLSGSPSFATDDDWVGPSIYLGGALGKSVTVPLNPVGGKLGDLVLSGDTGLVEGFAGSIYLVGADDMIVNGEGKLDTATTSLISDGTELAAALGSDASASSFDEATGTYTITLSGDCARSQRLIIDSGSYVIAGTGTISRAGGYDGVLFDISSGTSVELSGSVVVDGGARWTIDGAPVDTAVGSQNEGLRATMSLVDVHGGAFSISESAALCNNDSLAAIYCENGRVEVTGGSISGNSTVASTERYGSAIHCAGSSAKALISGGSLSGNAGPAAVLGPVVTITGGSFSGNDGAVLCTSNAQGIELSGSPSFATDADWVGPTATIAGAFGKSVTVPLDAGTHVLGDQVLFGDENLVKGYATCFALVGANAGLVVNEEGRIDSPEGGMITDGKALAEKLGGEGVATSTQDPSTGTFTITLSGDSSCSQPIFLKSGSYVLAGEGTISRAAGYTASLIRVAEGASLEIGGSVVLDGGAVWEKDSARVDTAVGSVNTGATATGALVDCAGAFCLSGSAELRNNDRPNDDGGALDATGPIVIKGGRIYANRAYNDAAASFNSTFEMSDGEIFGNLCTLSSGSIAVIHGWDNAKSDVLISGGKVHDNDPRHSAIMARTVTISGGEFANCQDGVIWWGENCQAVTIAGGTFSGNSRVYGTDETYPHTFELSGAPVLVTDTDTFNGPARLTGALTGDSPIRIRLASYDLGRVIASGTDSYDVTASDAAKFVLGTNAPADRYVHFDPDAKQVVIADQPDDPIEPVDPCAAGHTMQDFVVPATLDADGCHGQKCSVCGSEVRGDTISRPSTFSLAASSYTFDGTTHKPAVTVRDAAGKTIDPAHYSVAYTNNVNAGTAHAKVTFDGRLYTGAKDLTFTINKAANPLKASGRTVKVKRASLANKAQTVKAKKAFKVKGAKGKVTYKKVKGNKKITVSSTGKVKVKKGLKKGTYKLKVKVTAAGNANYGKATKTVKVTVKVK